MSDSPFMIGANGLIVDTAINGLPGGYATVGQQPNVATGETPNVGDVPSAGPWIVTQLLPGAIIQLVGGGEFDLLSTARSPMLAIGSGSSPQLGGTMGSVQLDLVTGASGSATPVVYIATPAGLGVAPPTLYVEVSLDASNRPTFAVTDSSGVVKAQGSPSGSAISAGILLSLRLFWDSTGKIIPDYVTFYSNGVVQPLGTVTGPWTAFQPQAIYYGRGASVGGGNPFTGRLLKVQAGNHSRPTIY